VTAAHVTEQIASLCDAIQKLSNKKQTRKLGCSG
jgi:hypothetical protein